jgi:putative transposase
MAEAGVHGALRPEDVFAKMREVDVLVAHGLTIMEALKTIGLRLATYRRWREELDGLKHDETRRVRMLEAENAELRRVAAVLVVRTAELRDAVRKVERSKGDHVAGRGSRRHQPCRLHRAAISQE